METALFWAHGYWWFLKIWFTPPPPLPLWHFVILPPDYLYAFQGIFVTLKIMAVSSLLLMLDTFNDQQLFLNMYHDTEGSSFLITISMSVEYHDYWLYLYMLYVSQHTHGKCITSFRHCIVITILCMPVDMSLSLNASACLQASPSLSIHPC